MSISGVSSYLYTNTSELYGSQDTSTVSDDASSSKAGSTRASENDSLDLSKPTEIYAKLQELAESDPEKLKEVCAGIAEKLKSASENSTGRDSQMLADLAEKFQNVADGGDISQLKPPEPPSLGGGPPPKPVEQYSKQQDAAQMIGQLNQSDDEDDADQWLSMILSDLDQAISD